VADVEGPLHDDVIPVPREAFIEDAVFVVRAGEAGGPEVAAEVRPTTVRVLPAAVLVKPADDAQGLRDGDRVVVSNLEDIADGSRLRTTGATESAPR
jgi:hypothetical protein